MCIRALPLDNTCTHASCSSVNSVSVEKFFEKRILNWSHRWLTLGGKVTLVKYVLESIHVYWISLAKFLKILLNRIRRKMFNFLWTRKKLKVGMHLVN